MCLTLEPLKQLNLCIRGHSLRCKENLLKIKLVTVCDRVKIFLIFSPFEQKIGMLYIDGGHDKRTVMSDTQNAFKMLSCNRFSCMVWDEYNNPDYPEVTEYLDDVSKGRDIFHIEESMLCFYMNNAQGV